MFNQQVEEYTRAFIKEFGLVDPNQTWNTAQSSAITLDLGSRVASSIKMYCKVDNSYYIIANLVNLSGEIEVPVDIPENTQEVLIKIDGTEYHVQPGTKIDCSSFYGSRAGYNEGSTYTDVTKADPIYFDAYTEMFPIVNKWSGLVSEGQRGNWERNAMSFDLHNGYIVQNFTIDPGADGTFTVYPMFYGSNLIHQ